jgi:hypothetical protein
MALIQGVSNLDRYLHCDRFAVLISRPESVSADGSDRIRIQTGIKLS